MERDRNWHKWFTAYLAINRITRRIEYQDSSYMWQIRLIVCKTPLVHYQREEIDRTPQNIGFRSFD